MISCTFTLFPTFEYSLLPVQNLKKDRTRQASQIVYFTSRWGCGAARAFNFFISEN